ncbi:MAG: hypothetical protein HC886_07280 [Leptolyngbyaceae cyanobacterium SM1_1_3]|nr:hypothetical protein [Leptolyngbyaceae cyanobacterium SM1_1_3]
MQTRASKPQPPQLAAKGKSQPQPPQSETARTSELSAYPLQSDPFNTGISDHFAQSTPFASRPFAAARQTAAPDLSAQLAPAQIQGFDPMSVSLFAGGSPPAVRHEPDATRLTTENPFTPTEADKIQRQSPLDWLTDRVGDALDTRDDEVRLDAEEDLAAFMNEDYTVANHHPTTGRGLFDAAYQPRTGAMTVTLKLCFQFASGDRTNADWIAAVGGPVAAAAYTDEQFNWQEGEADAWKGNAIAEVETAWSDQYTFHNTQPHWETLPNVNVRISIVETPADEAHFVTTVNKWPKDGGVRDAVTPPGRADHSTAHFEESADNGITNPDSSHFVRNTNSRAAYQIVDTNNPGQILFNLGSAEISAADQARLQTFGTTLGRPEIPPFPVTLTGHSSSEGDEA